MNRSLILTRGASLVTLTAAMAFVLSICLGLV